MTIANIIVAVAAVLISVIALSKGDPQETKVLQTELKRKLRLVDSLLQYQKEMDSLRILVEQHIKDSRSLNSIH